MIRSILVSVTLTLSTLWFFVKLLSSNIASGLSAFVVLFLGKAIFVMDYFRDHWIFTYPNHSMRYKSSALYITELFVTVQLCGMGSSTVALIFIQGFQFCLALGGWFWCGLE